MAGNGKIVGIIKDAIVKVMKVQLLNINLRGFCLTISQRIGVLQKFVDLDDFLKAERSRHWIFN